MSDPVLIRNRRRRPGSGPSIPDCAIRGGRGELVDGTQEVSPGKIVLRFHLICNR